jgi:hypothetical protein
MSGFIKIVTGSSSNVLDTTVSEHYSQHSEAIQDILKGLDGYGNISGYGADGYVAFFTGTPTIAGDNDLKWNRETNRLEIGGTGVKLHDTWLTSDSEGKLIISNSAGDQGVIFDTTTDGQLTLTDESAGALNLRIDGRIFDGAGPLNLGKSAVTSRSLTTEDVLIGGKLEVDGVASFDDYALFYSATGFYNHLTMTRNKLLYVGPEGMWLVLSTEYSPYPGGFFLHPSSNHLLVGSQTYYEYNYGYSVPDDPTIILKSSENPATDSTQDSRWTWNRLALGGNGAGLGCVNQTIAYDDFTDGGGVVGTLDLDEQIPDGAVVVACILHTLTGFTGGVNSTATIQVGDGTVVDRYNTGTPDVYTSNASGVDMGDPSGTKWHDAAKTVTVTITVDNDWTSVSAGECTIGILYWSP